MSQQSPFAGSLKLSLPGIDPRSVPLLSSDQVSDIPSSLLHILFMLGEAQDFGDLTILTVNDDDHKTTIKNVAQWIAHRERAEFLAHGDLEVTRERNTHQLFLERLDLFTFFIRADLESFQTHLSEELTTDFPVYEAELTALLSQLSNSDLGSLDTVDANLAAFVRERTSMLRPLLVASPAFVPILRTYVSPEDRLMSLLPHAGTDVVEAAIAEVYRQLGVQAETAALIDTFVNSDRAISSEREDSPETSDIDVSHPHPQRPTANAAGVPNTRVEDRMRRKGPTAEDFHGILQGGCATLLKTRPRVDGEYWSVTLAKWSGLTHKRQNRFAHADFICETTAGTVAPEPCGECERKGLVCEVYVEGIGSNSVGWSCARCRVSNKSSCSLSGRVGKRKLSDDDDE